MDRRRALAREPARTELAANINIYIYIYTYIYIYIIYVYIDMYMYMYVCVYIYIYICCGHPLQALLAGDGWDGTAS